MFLALGNLPKILPPTNLPLYCILSINKLIEPDIAAPPAATLDMSIPSGVNANSAICKSVSSSSGIPVFLPNAARKALSSYSPYSCRA